MTETKKLKKLSLRSTKEEMLAAYNDVVHQMDENRGAEVKAEVRAEQRVVQQAVQVADGLSTDEIAKHAGTLKAEVGKLLSQLTDRLEEEINKFNQAKKAVQAKDGELKEIYEIQRSASSLSALIEAQQIKRAEFDDDMAERKEQLTREIDTLRSDWDKEKKLREAEIKERDAAEAKRREREKEEYRYAFTREQNLTREQFDDQKAKLEREIQFKQEEMERELSEREKVVAQREAEQDSLRKRVESFPAELEAAVAKAVTDAIDRAQTTAKSREELVKKEFMGERNVLTTKIESLERTVVEQNEHIAKLSQQLEKSYSQVQDIAVKAIDGSANLKSLANLQQMLAESTRRQPAEK